MTLKPMLANSIEVSSLEEYIKDDDFFFEQKLDGQRVLLSYENGRFTPLERHGNVYQYDAHFQDGAWKDMAVAFKDYKLILDGEYMDRILYLFDFPYLEHLLSGVAINFTDSYEFRRQMLDMAVKGDKLFNITGPIQLVPTARTAVEKAQLTTRCIKNRAEGVMVKHRYGQYEIGKRSNFCLKAKFEKDADVVVMATGLEGKNNALLGVYDKDGTLKPVGRCSLNGKPKVKVDDVIVVKYLYLGANKKLVQCSMLNVRTDKLPEECFFAQLIPTNKEVLL